MLEGVLVVVDKVVIVIGVAEKYIGLCEYECGADIGARQAGKLRVAECEYIFVFVLQVAAMLVAKVGSGGAVAYALAWCLHTHTAMICGNEYLYVPIGDLT